MTDTPDPDTVMLLARVCHEANRALCYGQGDSSMLPWGQAQEWQRRSAVAGVTGILDGTITSPEQSHTHWMAEKTHNGWTYGPVKDEAKKTHPAMLPYAELPTFQKKKDALFYAIVNALK